MKESNKEVMYLQIKEGLYGDELEQYNKLYFKFFDLTDRNSHLDKRKEKKWQKYINELNVLSDKNSLLALKIIIALLYRPSILYYNEKMFEFLKKQQDIYFLNPSTLRDDRLTFGIDLVIVWPDDIRSGLIDYFTTPIELLMIETAKENPEYALKLFDKAVNRDKANSPNNKYRNYFFSILNNSPINLLKFAREVKAYRPLLFANALVNFIHYCNNDYEYYKLNDKVLNHTKLITVSTELYEMINKNTFPKGFNLENALQKMIRYCPMEVSWYQNLFDKLWEIESAKNEKDKASLGNYFLIFVNSTNKELIENVEKHYFVWREQYKYFDIKNSDLFSEHISELYNVSRNIFNNNFASYRNIHLDPIDIQKNIIDDLFMLYLDILAWVKEKNKRLYFSILIDYIQEDYYFDEVIPKMSKISKKAKSIFIDEFESFANEDRESATYIIGILLQNSRRYKTININKVLNKVFFTLEDIDKVSANNELFKVLKKEEEHHEYCDRGGPSPWSPSYAVTTTYATPDLLERLSQSNDDEIRKNVAKNSNTPLKVLSILSQDSNEDVRANIASNPNTPIEILSIMSKDSSIYVRGRIALNSSTPLEILKKLIDNGEEDIISCVVRNPHMNADFLYEMSKYGSTYIRWNTAMNPDIPQKCIRLLFIDKDSTVRANIAEHSKTSSYILAKMSKDIEYSVRQNVAKNPNTSSDVLDALSKSYVNIFSRDALNIRSKNIKKKLKSFYWTLKYKITGNHPKHRFRVTYFPYSSDIDIKCEYRTIRSNVALNPNTSLTTLERLLNDEDSYVASMAESMIKT